MARLSLYSVCVAFVGQTQSVLCMCSVCWPDSVCALYVQRLLARLSLHSVCVVFIVQTQSVLCMCSVCWTDSILCIGTVCWTDSILCCMCSVCWLNHYRRRARTSNIIIVFSAYTCIIVFGAGSRLSTSAKDGNVSVNIGGSARGRWGGGRGGGGGGGT